MNDLDRAFLSLVRASLDHNSLIIEAASMVTGTMANRKPSDYRKIAKEFRRIHDGYSKDIEDIIKNLEVHANERKNSTAE